MDDETEQGVLGGNSLFMVVHSTVEAQVLTELNQLCTEV